MIFDGDNDVEGPRFPKAHLDTVLRNLSHHLGRPFRERGLVGDSSYCVKLQPRKIQPFRRWGAAEGGQAVAGRVPLIPIPDLA